MSPLDLALVASRTVQYAAAALLGGSSLFFLYAGDQPHAPWRGRLVVAGALAGALAAIAWLMAQAGQLGDTPAAAFDFGVVGDVATSTSFGRVALGRAVAFLLGGVAVSAL